MDRTRCMLVISLLLMVGGARAEAPPSPDGPAGPPAAAPAAPIKFGLPDLKLEREFDGIEMSKYDRFWEKWKLITVRYRKDNNEQRFVYANDIAYKAYRAGEKVYPDGAMFGKVAFLAQVDESFPSSLEPRTFTRIQLMKKNKAKYKDTNGWGYGFYAAGTGVPYNDEKVTVTACHACHTLVPNRDYVFSKSSFEMNASNPQFDSTFRSRFNEKPFSQLYEKAKSALRATGVAIADTAVIRSLTMPLFAGSINEAVGPILNYSDKERAPFLLIDPGSELFLAAVPAANVTCASAVMFARTMNVHVLRPVVSDHLQVNRGTGCRDEVKWDKAVAPPAGK